MEGWVTTHSVEVLSTSESYLCVDGRLFREYVCNELVHNWDCYICRGDLYKDVEILDKPSIGLVADGDESTRRL